jgi:hypothetical protein
MKKFIFTLAIIFACVSASMAQDDVFKKGDKVFQIGIGLGNDLNGTGYSTTIPPIVISGEYGITDALIKKTGKGYVGVGGYFAYTANKSKYDISGHEYGWKWTYMIIAGRGAFHYQFVDKLDTYAGVIAGFNIASSKYYGWDGYTGDAASAGGFTYSTFVGARYYFTNNIAAFAEAGFGFNLLEAGLAIKF